MPNLLLLRLMITYQILTRSSFGPYKHTLRNGFPMEHQLDLNIAIMSVRMCDLYDCSPHLRQAAGCSVELTLDHSRRADSTRLS